MLNSPIMAGFSPCQQTQSYLRAMTTPPSGGRVMVIDRCIRQLVSSGLFSKFDFLYLMAAHNEQASRLNVVKPGSNTLTLNGTFTAANGFVVDQGWTAVTVVTDFLSTGLAMNTAGLKLVQNSAHMGVWSRTNNKQAADRSYDMGDANTEAAVGRSDNGSGAFYCRPTDTTSFDSAASTYYPGHASWSRTAAAVFRCYSQGVDIGDGGTTASTAVGTGAINVLKVGTAGSVNQIAAAHMGSALVAADVANLYGILRDYMKSIGAA